MEQHQPVVDEKKESPSADGYIPHESPMHSDPNAVMNGHGGMPPQQVYVNTAMAHHHHMADLDAQFQSLGMNGMHDLSNRDGEDDDVEGEGNDEDEPVKLFIGQVRKIFSRNSMLSAINATHTCRDVYCALRCMW